VHGRSEIIPGGGGGGGFYGVLIFFNFYCLRVLKKIFFFY
jgi:hypothetical protein